MWVFVYVCTDMQKYAEGHIGYTRKVELNEFREDIINFKIYVFGYIHLLMGAHMAFLISKESYIKK